MKIDNIAVYELVRKILNGGIFTRSIGVELAAKKSETVLDIGCGTGVYSKIVPGTYIGLDINRRLISYAQQKYSSNQRSFYNQSLEEFILKKTSHPIDKCLIINVLHHLSDKEVNSLLKLVNHIVKEKIIIVDTDKGGANIFQRFLYLFDDGHFIRTRDELRHLITKHFRIKRDFIFCTPTRSIRLCLFNCIPLRST